MDKENAMSFKPLLATCVASSIAVALLSGGTAIAEPIVVLNTGAHRDTIISRGDLRIHLFANEVTIDPAPTPGGDAFYSMNFNFQFQFGNPKDVVGAISSNELPVDPDFPLQTACILAEGGLRLEGSVIDLSRVFDPPRYDPETGTVIPAFITNGTGPFAGFNLESFADGDMAYIGYSSSDFSSFGYMQVQRQSVLEWKLIGYAFDAAQEGILVRNLAIPNGPTLLTLGLGGASGLLRKRR